MNSGRANLTSQIKEASDIVAIIGGYITLSPNGNGYKGLCPFHNDSRPSFQVQPKWQNFRCWACGKRGDVFTFIQEIEKVNFLEATELLARRAGINTSQFASSNNDNRQKLLDVISFAADRYSECLLESGLAEQARCYLGERKLNGPTVRSFGLGYAPMTGEWLAELVRKSGQSIADYVEVGLLGERSESAGFYDRFRDRVMFPIRNLRSQIVGFGGRILPNSPFATRSPKYYNSCETPLFNKSELLFGIDKARHAGATEGYLAVVEGYTDVMMAHQLGLLQVVATMGTALNAKHVYQLRRIVPRVVLVFDADQGGELGVDRALELFISHDVDLSIASLPEGLDPCDWLIQSGVEPFRKAIQNAQDALDFKLSKLLERELNSGIEGTRRTVDAILHIMSMAPALPGQSGRVKQELLITRLAHRLGLRQETVWARFGELKDNHQKNRKAKPIASPDGSDSENKMVESKVRTAPAPTLELQLLQILLAEPALLETAGKEINSEDITHPGLKRLFLSLLEIHQLKLTASLDELRLRITQDALINKAMEMQEIGLMMPDRQVWLQRIIREFQKQKTGLEKKTLQNQLSKASDHQLAVELLKRLQEKSPVSDS